MKKKIAVPKKKTLNEKTIINEDLIAEFKAYLGVAPWFGSKLRGGKNDVIAVVIWESVRDFLTEHNSALVKFSWDDLDYKQQKNQENTPLKELVMIENLMKYCIKHWDPAESLQKSWELLELSEEDMCLLFPKEEVKGEEKEEKKEEKSEEIKNKESTVRNKFSFNPFSDGNGDKDINQLPSDFKRLNLN